MEEFYENIRTTYDNNTCYVIKQYSKQQKRLAKQNERLKYLLRCSDYGIEPPHLKRKMRKFQHGFKLDITKGLLLKVEKQFLTKVIQKNRAKIRDARDKLAELTRASGDARKRLMQKQLALDHSGLKPPGSKLPYRNGHLGAGISLRRKHIEKDYLYPDKPGRLAAVVGAPRGYVDYDNMEQMEEEELQSATRLSRTVKNDMAHYSSARSKSSAGVGPPPAPRHLNSWGPAPDHFDPFDVYEVKSQSRLERRMSPDLHDLPPPPMPKGILRSSRQRSPREDSAFHRRYIPEPTSHLSYEMRSRLEHAPDPHASVGIFSNPLKHSAARDTSSLSSGFRIVVSNLHTNVTQSDIKELFEDIGELYESRIVRPGVAEVIYRKLADAEAAVETYHNRQLDGQPMKCLLVNPRASNKPTAPAIKTNR